MNHHQPRKRFGQNFLVDPNTIERIVSAVAPKPQDNLIEIGPGQGALTGPLLARCPNLRVIELDRDLVPLLQQRFQGLRIYQQDALQTDFKQFVQTDSNSATQPLRIVGNLPYNISTPLLFHLLGFEDDIQDMHFMLQKEVVDRLAAGPGGKNYGRLSVMVQYHCQVIPLFAVPPGAFRPAPKVDSAIVRLVPHRAKPVTANNPALLGQLVNSCFQQRRKTLRNSLRQLVPAETLDTLPIDTGRRPETLSVADFVALSDSLESATAGMPRHDR